MSQSIDFEPTSYKVLWDLCKKIVADLEPYFLDQSALKSPNLFLRSKVKEFSYDRGACRSSIERSIVTELDWDSRSLYALAAELEAKHPVAKECRKILSHEYNFAPVQVDAIFHPFLTRLIRSYLMDQRDETIVDCITNFIRDLDQSPTDWKILVSLEGLWPEDQRLEILDGFFLRQVVESDLETDQAVDMLPFADYSQPFKVPNSFLETQLRTADRNEIDREISKIVDLLLLFKRGSVYITRIQKTPRSLHSGQEYGSGGRSFSSRYKYQFRKDNVSPFQDFVDKTRRYLPTRQNSSELSESKTSILVAFERYKEAVLYPVTIENSITSAITCLEALFLKATERSELSHKLSQRAAALLRYFNFPTIKVYRQLQQAYEIRSRFIHGAAGTSEGGGAPTELCDVVLEYARVSVAAFVQLSPYVEKDDMLGKIDHSLLESNAEKKLANLVANNTFVALTMNC
ncbi:hypothetical protein ACFLU6_11135 [Acidobacteriota bacterium]